MLIIRLDVLNTFTVKNKFVDVIEDIDNLSIESDLKPLIEEVEGIPLNTMDGIRHNNVNKSLPRVASVSLMDYDVRDTNIVCLLLIKLPLSLYTQLQDLSILRFVGIIINSFDMV